jgi:hypothetical protein
MKPLILLLALCPLPSTFAKPNIVVTPADDHGHGSAG